MCRVPQPGQYVLNGTAYNVVDHVAQPGKGWHNSTMYLRTAVGLLLVDRFTVPTDQSSANASFSICAFLPASVFTHAEWERLAIAR